MLTVHQIIKVGRMREQCDTDSSIIRHRLNIDRNGTSKSVRVCLREEEGEDGDVRIVQLDPDTQQQS